MSAFGDIVHAFQSARYLKDTYPGCSIEWAVDVRMAKLLHAHPLVDRVIAIDTKRIKQKPFSSSSYKALFSDIKNLRKKQYDLVFDLQGNCKSAAVTFFAKAKTKIGFGFRSAPESIASIVLDKRFNPPKGGNIRNDYLHIVQSYVQKGCSVSEKIHLRLTEEEKTALQNFPEGAWLICPGSNWSNKKLTAQTLLAFLEKVYSAYHPQFLFLCGNDLEKKEAEMLQGHFANAKMCYRPSYGLLQHIMQKCAMIISVESFSLHLAATCNTKTFSIFGPSSSAKYAPIGFQHKSVQGSCPYGQTFDKRCKKLRTCPTGACMHDLDPDLLFESFCCFFETSKSKI
jgi:heptosyltransferase-1